jgi:Family of unknown function (DUF6152)
MIARSTRHLWLCGFGSLLWAASALAHHTAAMFDEQKSLSLSGTVREFQWHNPHCYIQLMVPSSKGKDVEWSLEMAAPMYLYNLWWRPSSIKTGDKITVKISPLRNGSSGGLVTEAARADGKLIGRAK